MIRYRAVQNKVRTLVESLNEHDYRAQFHPELSPLGWHLGHCLYIENYWLREVLDKDKSLTKGLDKLYIPEKSPKPERGKKLPAQKQMLSTAVEYQDNNALLLLEMMPPYSEQPLFENEYMQYFIIQHYAQHYETMQMVLQQRALQQDYSDYVVQQILQPKQNMVAIQSISGGQYQVGSDSNVAYDNERPRHGIQLNDFAIAERPASNAEYLGFIEDNGYQQQSLWSDEGWAWLQQHEVIAPEHWQQDQNENWFAISNEGAADLDPAHAVFGINHFEASAFARWSNARLPHEHEWEVALTEHQLPNTGYVWEWCNNRFAPYPGFKAFPYDGYSRPSFEEPHFVLRGASHRSRVEIKRPSFRNFFGPDKRHIFAGCRLVFN